MSIQELQVEHGGHTIALEVDASPFLTYRARLFVDGAPADHRDVLSGTFRLHGASAPGQQENVTRFVVEVKLGFWGQVKRAELRTADGGALPLRPVKHGR